MRQRGSRLVRGGAGLPGWGRGLGSGAPLLEGASLGQRGQRGRRGISRERAGETGRPVGHGAERGRPLFVMPGSLGPEHSFPGSVGHCDCSKAGNEMGRRQPWAGWVGRWAVPPGRGGVHGFWKPPQALLSSLPIVLWTFYAATSP